MRTDHGYDCRDHLLAARADVLPRRPARRRHAPRLVRSGRQPVRRLPRALRGHRRGVVPDACDAKGNHRRADRLHAAAGLHGSDRGRVRRPLAAQADAHRERFDPRRSGLVADLLRFDLERLRGARRAELRLRVFRPGTDGHDSHARAGRRADLGQRPDADRVHGQPHRRAGGCRHARRPVRPQRVLLTRRAQLSRVGEPHRIGDHQAACVDESADRIVEQSHPRDLDRHARGNVVRRASRPHPVRRSGDGGGSVHDRMLRSAHRDLRTRLAARAPSGSSAGWWGSDCSPAHS